MDIAFWGIGGWCGSVPLSVLIAYILRHHHPPVPDPEPWRLEGLASRVLGALAGIAGGYVVQRFAGGAPGLSTVSLVAAFASGFVASDLYGFAVGRAPAGQRSAAPAAGVR